MKSTQLLSVVLSLIMFTGMSVGGAAFAVSDELEDQLEDYCEMSDSEQSDLLAEYDLSDLESDLAEICAIEDENEREDELEMLIDELELDTYEEEIEDLDDVLEDYCFLDADAQDAVISDYSLSDFASEIDAFCSIDDVNEREDLIDEFIDTYFPEARDDDDDEADDDVIDSFEDCVEAGFPVMESFPEQCMTDDGMVFVNDRDDDYDDDHDDRDKVLVCHKGKTLHIGADALRAHLSHGDHEGRCDGDRTDYKYDKLSDKMHAITDVREHMDRFCELSDAEKDEHIAEHEPTQEHIDKVMEYCSLDDDGRDAFIEENRDEIKAHMADKMRDYKPDKRHMEYERFCNMSDEDLAASTLDSEFVEKASEWCDMTPEEKEEYRKDHRDSMSDRMTDKMAKFDDKLSDRMEKFDKKMEKFSDKSMRLKAMIEGHSDISDDRKAELLKKFEKKQGKIDKKISELKSKFQKHMAKMHFKMISDERKSEIHDRLAEMKAFKKELREKDSELSDEQKQQLREDFIEKAKDMQLAWINPRTQIAAGVDPVDVECREGYSLVMKESNGVAMCIKADTALKLIDRGIVVPAN